MLRDCFQWIMRVVPGHTRGIGRLALTEVPDLRKRFADQGKDKKSTLYEPLSRGGRRASREHPTVAAAAPTPDGQGRLTKNVYAEIRKNWQARQLTASLLKKYSGTGNWA